MTETVSTPLPDDQELPLAGESADAATSTDTVAPAVDDAAPESSTSV